MVRTICGTICGTVCECSAQSFCGVAVVLCLSSVLRNAFHFTYMVLVNEY
jgi:hypothetical protein